MNNILNNKKLVIFDLDGVLFDSDKANKAYFYRCLEITDNTHLWSSVEDKIGYMSLEQLIMELIPNRNEAIDIIKKCKLLPYDPFLEELQPLFDFESVLGKLKNKFYLATASNRGKSLVTVFKHFKLFEYFSFKISAIEAKAKPDPEMLLKCTEYFDITKERSLFLGDAASDHEAARSADIDFIWVGNKNEKNGIMNVPDILKYM